MTKVRTIATTTSSGSSRQNEPLRFFLPSLPGRLCPAPSLPVPSLPRERRPGPEEAPASSSRPGPATAPPRRCLPVSGPSPVVSVTSEPCSAAVAVAGLRGGRDAAGEQGDVGLRPGGRRLGGLDRRRRAASPSRGSRARRTPGPAGRGRPTAGRPGTGRTRSGRRVLAVAVLAVRSAGPFPYWPGPAWPFGAGRSAATGRCRTGRGPPGRRGARAGADRRGRGRAVRPARRSVWPAVLPGAGLAGRLARSGLAVRGPPVRLRAGRAAARGLRRRRRGPARRRRPTGGRWGRGRRGAARAGRRGPTRGPPGLACP